MLFSHCVITKVMGDDENTYFKVFLDVHDHLGEVHLKTTVTVSSSTTISLVTTLSKGHSLGHPLVNALLLAVRGAGPHPDGHGLLEKI